MAAARRRRVFQGINRLIHRSRVDCAKCRTERAAANAHSTQSGRETPVAIAIKAWNAWREGKSLQTPSWRGEGRRAELSPEPRDRLLVGAAFSRFTVVVLPRHLWCMPVTSLRSRVQRDHQAKVQGGPANAVGCNGIPPGPGGTVGRGKRHVDV